MVGGYGSHAEYMSWVSEDADARHTKIENALRQAFASFIDQKNVDVIVFSEMDVHQLIEQKRRANTRVGS